MFEEETHRYSSLIDGKEVTYTSGTCFCGKFFPQFDPTGKITERCAQKEGITVEALKAKWAAKGKASCIFGTKVHSICEDVILGRDIREKSPADLKETNTFAVAKKVASKFKQSLDILGVEKVVFDCDLPTPIAGTIDLFARSRKDGSYLILDWKTNQTIETENPYKKFCLDPISHIPDNSFYHYALQTSLYQFLLKFGKYVPKDAKFKRAIIHLMENSYKIYELPDLTSEIKDMLIWQECKFSKNAI